MFQQTFVTVFKDGTTPMVLTTIARALFKSGEDAFANTLYSMEQGYCCQVDPAPTSCDWKYVSTHSTEDWTCDDGSYLNGFKVNANGNQLANVVQIKCCGGDRRSLRANIRKH